MAKKHKVKHYKKIYSGSRLSRMTPLGIVSSILVVALLGFVGWSAYEPVVNLLSGNLFPTSTKPDTESTPEPESTPESKPEEQPPAPLQTGDELKAVYAGLDVLADSAKFDSFLTEAKASGYNAVMIELKDATGMLSYVSQVPAAVQIGAVVPSPIDLKQITSKLTENNMKGIAKISAFRDTKAPSKLDGSGVKYSGGEGMLWLDNSAENGGKPWLNPYAPTAQKYITDLALEAVANGFPHVVLDRVQFPTGVGLNLAAYGQNSMDKAAVLASFVKSASDAVAAQGGKLLAQIPATAAMGVGLEPYGGVNPASVFGTDILLDASPSQFGEGIDVNGVKISSAADQFGTTVGQILSTVKPMIGEKTTLMVLLQAYNPANQGTLYTAEQMKAQIDPLAAHELASYVLVSPTSAYPSTN